jgi:hypothetical protein
MIAGERSPVIVLFIYPTAHAYLHPAPGDKWRSREFSKPADELEPSR